MKERLVITLDTLKQTNAGVRVQQVASVTLQQQ